MKSPNKLRFGKKHKKFGFGGINVIILLSFIIFILLIFMTLWFVQALAVEGLADEHGKVPEMISVIEMRFTLLYVTIGALAVGLIASWVLTYFISKPLISLSAAAKRVADGDKDIKFNDIKGYNEVEELAESLTEMSSQLTRTDALRRDLLANISHDLRTPLTVIKTRAEMIKDMSDDKEKRDKNLLLIMEEADKLSSLVQDILDLSKIEAAGKEGAEWSEFDMSQLAKRVVGRFEPFTEQGYTFILEADDKAVVNADERRMEQALYNLVSNAVNYTGDDKKIFVTVKVTDQGLTRVEVRDTGKGIAPEEIERVWQRFYRSGTTSSKRKGTGLGLTIVKTVLETHGANFGVQSELNKGSVFYFEL